VALLPERLDAIRRRHTSGHYPPGASPIEDAGELLDHIAALSANEGQALERAEQAEARLRRVRRLLDSRALAVTGEARSRLRAATDWPAGNR